NTILKTDSYISVVHLSEQFNVSRRTIYSELDKIDDWLKQNYSTELIRVRGKGLYVSQSLKSQILNDSILSTETYYEFSKEERKSEEHTSELQSRFDLVCRLLLEKKN